MESMELKNNDFWKGKKVFITGHTGFKGGWLSIFLENLGAEIHGFSLKPHEKSFFNAVNLGDKINHQVGDIRNLKLLKENLLKVNPEIIFHLAAQPLVRYSYNHPLETYSTNVMGTANLLEASRSLANLKSIVVVTSDKCYENKEWDWGYRENESLGGKDPYSSSKACTELVAMAYNHSFFSKTPIQLATGRAGNVIGGGDWSEDRLIPDILDAFENKTELIVRSPKAVRPWQHVLEPLAGYIQLAELQYKYPAQFNQSWNFGPEDVDCKNVQYLVERIAHKWLTPVKWKIQCNENDMPEAGILKLDSSKSKRFLNWKPKWSIDQALDKIIEWQSHYRNGADMYYTSSRQILDYMKVNP